MEEPVEETRRELVQRLTQELIIDREERAEEDQQKVHELTRNKNHWKNQIKKQGRGRPEKDEGLKERFPLGKVSCISTYDQCIQIIFFSSPVYSSICRK